MFRVLAVAAGALVAVGIVRTYLNFRRNLAEAKQSGIKYIVIPIYTFHIFWLLTSRLWLPLLEKLPKSWTDSWLPFLHPEWNYRYGHAAFEKHGTDLLLLVSPQKNHLYVASAMSIAQITTQRANFPKPIEIYKGIDLYGKNVVTLEGSQWRAHRKLTAPSFGEKNNELVWNESLHQAKALVDSWGVGRHVSHPAQGTMTLALHVISRAGFGVKVTWPHEDVVVPADADKGGMGRFAGNEPLEGCSMSYKEAIQSLLENIIWLPVLPKWFMPRSPVEAHKRAFTAWNEWGKYMEAVRKAKKADMTTTGSSSSDGMDLFGALIRGSADAQPSGKAKTATGSPGLSDSEIYGNAFVFFLAGHETTANLLHFALLLLALNPSSQSELHASIDAIFADKPDPATWSYEEDFPKLFGAMPAAVMNETLRIIPAVVGIPKCTEPGKPQRVAWEGGEVTVPGGCAISLSTPGVHQNPKYWPPVLDKNGRPDPRHVTKFRPQRWLLDPSSSSSAAAPGGSSDADGSDQEASDLQGPSGPDTSPSLWKPARGAFVPFSEGHRSCLGRRFAQVEAIAVLAYIFKFYSVELSVDDWASEEEVERMDAEQRREVWNKARDRAARLFQTGMRTIITLQMRDGNVPIRLVKRGQEKFAWRGDDGADDMEFVNEL